MSVARAGSGGIASTAKGPMELWGVTEILCFVGWWLTLCQKYSNWVNRSIVYELYFTTAG